MSNPFLCNCGCQNGCYQLASLGCKPSSCVHEKTDFQEDLAKWERRIRATELKIRLLKDRFRTRRATKCDDFKPLSLGAYQSKLHSYERKIAKYQRSIRYLQDVTKAGRLIRHSRPCTPSKCGCCNVV